MNLIIDVIVDGDFLLLPANCVECLRLHVKPFARLEDGAVEPLDMKDALLRIRNAGLSIGYRQVGP